MVFYAYRDLAQYVSLIPISVDCITKWKPSSSSTWTDMPDYICNFSLMLSFPIKYSLLSILFHQARKMSLLEHWSSPYVRGKHLVSEYKVHFLKRQSVIHQKSGAWSHPERGALIHFPTHRRGNGKRFHTITAFSFLG